MGAINRRGRLLALVLAGVVALWPTLLWAHARLLRSDPANDSRVQAPVTALRLWFSEIPELTMTRLSLRDSAGRIVRLGPVAQGDTTAAIVAQVLDSLAPGKYSVNWSLAGADGHPITGAFSFTVLHPATVAATDTASTRLPPKAAEGSTVALNGATSAEYTAARIVAFLAMIALVGVVAFALVVVPRVNGLESETRRRWLSGAAGLGLAAAVVSLLASVIRLWLQWRLINAALPGSVAIGSMITQTQWGRAWTLQTVAALLAAIAFMLARRSQSNFVLAGIAAAGLALGASLGGHAVASANHILAVTTDWLHIIGASAWLGSLLCVMVVALRPGREMSGDARWRETAALVTTFSPIALFAAALVVATGLVSAWLRLGALSPLWTSPYGRVLILKLFLLVGVAGTGAYNWLRVRPSLGTAAGNTRLRRSTSIELAIGALVIIVTALLVAVPTPLDSL